MNSINKELMVFDVDAKDKEGILKELADKMVTHGYVKETYYQGVIDREKIYPTGLLLGDFNVAIPHTESEYVLKNGIAVARLKHPVSFNYMADPSIVVQVDLIFMLAIHDPSKQVPVLSALMKILSVQDNISDLVSARDSNEFLIKLKEMEVNEE